MVEEDEIKTAKSLAEVKKSLFEVKGVSNPLRLMQVVPPSGKADSHEMREEWEGEEQECGYEGEEQEMPWPEEGEQEQGFGNMEVEQEHKDGEGDQEYEGFAGEQEAAYEENVEITEGQDYPVYEATTMEDIE
ncbi:unnamed protein product, partial [Symbiodinium sp. KB8]